MKDARLEMKQSVEHGRTELDLLTRIHLGT